MINNTERDYTVYYKFNQNNHCLNFTSFIPINDASKHEFFDENAEMSLFRNAYTVINSFNNGKTGVVKISRIEINDMPKSETETEID
jgi:hypothetical protein